MITFKKLNPTYVKAGSLSAYRLRLRERCEVRVVLFAMDTVGELQRIRAGVSSHR